MKRQFALIALAAIAVTACDSFDEAYVQNGCTQAIEVDQTPLGDSGQVAQVGESLEFYSSGGEFDLAVKAVGASDWDVTIMSAQLDRGSPDEPFVIAGGLCPDPASS